MGRLNILYIARKKKEEGGWRRDVCVPGRRHWNTCVMLCVCCRQMKDLDWTSNLSWTHFLGIIADGLCSSSVVAIWMVGLRECGRPCGREMVAAGKTRRGGTGSENIHLLPAFSAMDVSPGLDDAGLVASIDIHSVAVMR